MRGDAPVPMDERHVQHGKFAGAFRKRRERDPEGFQAEAKLIRQVTEMPGWALIMEITKEVHDAVNDRLVNSPDLPSPEEAARLIGEMNGLQQLQGIAHTFDVIDRHEEAKAADFARLAQRQTHQLERS